MVELTPTQRRIVSFNIGKETRLRNLAIAKMRRGRTLSKSEMRRIARTRPQVIRIGFEKARETDPSIPQFQERRVR